MKKVILGLVSLAAGMRAQEADSGFELRSTVSTAAFHTHQLAAKPRSGDPVTGGFRTVLYPTWKLSPNWSASGAIQIHSRPYFSEEFATQGYGVKGDVLRAELIYSRYGAGRSVVVRLGQLSTAFGSFLLRYDDADNPLIAMPISYGYYGKGVSIYGLAGAQVDATLGKLDARAQFVSSSPANRRGLFDHDQYGNWSGGIGYTIRQGLRVGASAYRGPYLHRQHEFYRPGEAAPRDLPATAWGFDAQWGHGPWNVSGEFHRFQMAYRAVPTIHRRTAYAEVRRVMHPRWYLATRLGFVRANRSSEYDSYETAIGFRPNFHQLIKVGYQIQKGPKIRGTLANTFAIQFVTTFRAISLAHD